jgi:hypothetical protein
MIRMNFSELDLRFLRHYLIGERVGITWIPKKSFPENERGPTRFYVGVKFYDGIDDDHETYDNYVHFQRLPYSHMKINSRSGQPIYSDLIDNISSLGVQQHNIPSAWSIDMIVKSRLEPFQNLKDPKYGPWVNDEQFITEVLFMSLDLGGADLMYWASKMIHTEN